MKRVVTACSFVMAALLCSTCADEPAPMEAVIQYTACVGRSGTCGVSTCCATEPLRRYGEDHIVHCTVRPGDMADSYELDFEVYTNNSDDPAIYAEGLQFSSNASAPAPVRGCDSFEVREDGNIHEAQTCESLDTPPDEGGGCVLQLYLSEDNSILGTFECKEIPLPAQDKYFSTVQGGGISNGAIDISNCSVRVN